jgi:hypothetical protein
MTTMPIGSQFYCVACGNAQVDSGHFAREHGAVAAGAGVVLTGVLAPTHGCLPPAVPTAGTIMLPPDWECGICGRLWHAVGGICGGAWWAEVRGPRPPADPTPLSDTRFEAWYLRRIEDGTLGNSEGGSFGMDMIALAFRDGGDDARERVRVLEEANDRLRRFVADEDDRHVSAGGIHADPDL